MQLSDIMKNRVWLLACCLTLCAIPVWVSAAEGKAAASAKPSYTAIIDRAAKRHGVEAALIRAVIKVESNFNPEAVSRAGAIGLMQLMPETAADYGVENRDALFNPTVNVDAGTRHLKRLLKKYKNIHRALTAYNAGEASEVDFRRTGVYLETRKYTVSVIKYYQKFKKR